MMGWGEVKDVNDLQGFFPSRQQVFLFVCFVFLGPHLWHMEVPRLGVKWELQLLAYTTATATQDPNQVCDLPHGPWQRRILNQPRKARDQTCILMVTSQICFY